MIKLKYISFSLSLRNLVQALRCKSIPDTVSLKIVWSSTVRVSEIPNSGAGRYEKLTHTGVRAKTDNKISYYSLQHDSLSELTLVVVLFLFCFIFYLLFVSYKLFLSERGEGGILVLC